ncbi:hypothetical protein N8I77_006736 [Diaporthe amygdali]|uniref:Uncharacterized protein n=1 Tax=Phomopsis amygdali TaxID=1214568 RepID=A0AAD9SIC2_PHOAM|nr:hypothetical protein N8I77_006736 [Diaporthe amygdali]
MATSKPTKLKTDTVTLMVKNARLETDFSNSNSDEKYIGCGGFGSVHLETCFDVDVVWDDSDYEDEGEEGDARTKIGAFRAVKQLSKPRDQAKLSGKLLRELHSLVFFTKPKV